MRSLPAACLLAMMSGCRSAPLASSLDVTAHPELSELPADATLFVGGHLADDDPLRPLLAAHTPRELSLDAVEGIIGACNGAGCAALASGELERLSPRLLAQLAPIEVADGGLRALGSDRVPLRIAMRERDAVVGHEEAVAALLSPSQRLDPSVLSGEIPDGDVWAYARDQHRLVEQVRSWLAARGTDAAEDTLAELEEAYADRPALSDEIVAVAASLSTEDATLRLRLRCSDESGARKATLALHAMRAASRTDNPTHATIIDEAVITRSGVQIEITMAGLPVEELLR